MNDVFEVYQDKRGEWRWRRKASNGRIVGASIEGYSKRSDAEANLARGPNPNDRWEFFQDKRGEWRWRRKTVNGRIISASVEGYPKIEDAQGSAERQGFEKESR